MTLIVHYHPLASYCQKLLIALYENDLAFERRIIDLGDPAAYASFAALWPMAKMPVLVDAARGVTLPETSIVIDYLDCTYPGPVQLIPDERAAALEVRAWDRFHDLYVEAPMQKIVTDKLRPQGGGDPVGVERARTELRRAYGVLDAAMAGRTWAAGQDFSLADCAAAPALFYAGKIEPFAEIHPNLAAYYERLLARPSFARVLREAEPYFAMFPG